MKQDYPFFSEGYSQWTETIWQTSNHWERYNIDVGIITKILISMVIHTESKLDN